MSLCPQSPAMGTAWWWGHLGTPPLGAGEALPGRSCAPRAAAEHSRDPAPGGDCGARAPSLEKHPASEARLSPSEGKCKTCAFWQEKISGKISALQNRNLSTHRSRGQVSVSRVHFHLPLLGGTKNQPSFPHRNILVLVEESRSLHHPVSWALPLRPWCRRRGAGGHQLCYQPHRACQRGSASR